MARRTLTVAVAIVVAACGGGNGAITIPQTEATASRCEEASRSLLDEVASMLTVSGGGTLRDGMLVRSNDFDYVFFLAAEIDGPGLTERGDIGIWATNEPEGSGLILSADAVANEFSDWLHGPETEFGVDQFDDGAEEAERCQASR